jgi:hypothetical protein
MFVKMLVEEEVIRSVELSKIICILEIKCIFIINHFQKFQ